MSVEKSHSRQALILPVDVFADDHLARQRRMHELINKRFELFLGFRPPKIPKEIRQMVGDRLPDTTLRVIWFLPTPFLWRNDDDPKIIRDENANSPFELWKEEQYRKDVEDYMRVMADNLSPMQG